MPAQEQGGELNALPPSPGELAEEALDNPTPRILKALTEAEERGWTIGKVTTVVRLSKPSGPRQENCPGCGTARLTAGRPICQACRTLGRKAEPVIDYDGLPFYATWELTGWTPKGKPSWHFAGAQAANGQRLNERDIFTYLEDPSVIYPEPPEDENEASD
jgi:hypothetical protein